MKRFFLITLILVLLALLSLSIFHFFIKKEDTQSKKIDIEIFENDLDIVYGSDSAQLSIFMFSNYNCAFCRKFFKEAFPSLKSEYIDKNKIKLVVKLVDFTRNEKIMSSIKLSVCINEYGNFEKLNRLLLTEPKVIFTEEFGKVIEDLIEQNISIEECMYGGESDNYINQTYATFKINGITGTPTFIINNNVYKGYKEYKDFVKIIEKELKVSLH